jgi:anti-anti-sigma regulatory factor
MAKLVDKRSGLEYALGGEKVSIGRHASNAIVLKGMAISRFHCEVRSSGEQFHLRDLGSTYGTYLNGKKLDCQADGLRELADGDSITLGVNPAFPKGEYTLTFSPGSASRSATQAADPGAKAGAGPEEGRVTYRVDSEALTAVLSGAFRGPECEAMAEDVLARVRAAPQDVIFDLWRVSYMNSYAFGTFLKLDERMKVAGIRFTFANANGSVLKLLGLLGLTTTYGNHATVADALESLRAARKKK